MAAFSIVIYGLGDLRATLNLNRINKSIAKVIGSEVLSLNKTIEFEIAKRYNTQAPLSSVLVGKRTETAAFGKNIIKNGLTYKYKPVDLAKFPYTSYKGNINPVAKREGLVHEVAIRRGKSKIIYGKSHNGGFAQWNNGNRKYGKQMFERKSRSRKPLRVLFGPSLSEMALWTLENNKEVDKALDNVTLAIIDIL